MLGLALAAMVYAYFLSRHLSPYAGGADSSGYLNSARLLGRGQAFAYPRLLPEQVAATEYGQMTHQPLGFVMVDAERMAPTYPTGVPLQLLAASWIVGWKYSAYALNIGTALASGWLMYLLARHLGLGRWTAMGGAVWLLLCPLFIFAAVQPISDLPALFWSLLTLYCALHSPKDWRWSILAGLALGIAVLVRPSCLLLIIPVLMAVGRQWRAYLLIGLGGLPSALFLAFYNQQLYGSPFSTGYGSIWGTFSFDYLPHNSRHFARWIPTLLTPVLLLALASPWLMRRHRRASITLLAWLLTLTGFYLCYYHSGETWWYLRFILPVFPVLILAALYTLSTLWSRPRPVWINTLGLMSCLGLVFYGEIRQIKTLDVLNIERGERSYPEAAAWAQSHLPAESVLCTMQVSGAFYYYTDYILIRWDQVEPEKFAALFGTINRLQRPVYAALFDFETTDALRRMGGQWTKLATVGQVTFWQKQF